MTAPDPTRDGSGTPVVSVVVASFRAEKLLNSCLDSLLQQCADLGAELLVARAGTVGLAPLQERWPTVRFIAAPAGSSIPELRGIGLEAALGDVVALTEDHCVASPDWLRVLVGAADHVDAVGGAMDNAQRTRVLDWAAFFSEYGFFAKGAGTGSRPLITGANVAYRRSVVGDVAAMARRGEWENVVHDHLIAAGHALAFVEGAAVSQNQNYHFGSFCIDRFVHGRDYARRRLVTEGPMRRRWWRVLTSPVLPIILTARIARVIGQSQQAAFRRALPFTFVFLAAWGVGEAVGYVLGPRGQAVP